MNKKIAVVLKADKDIGTGHLMRVKSLLSYIDNADFYLVSDSLSVELESFCGEFKKILRGSKSELCALVLSLRPDLVLIDHYFLQKEFEEQIYPFTKVAVIDDLEREHICHILFDQGRDKTDLAYKGKVPPECTLCVGHSYNFIKPVFANLSKTPSKSGKLRVLVNFGGSDPAHACLNTVKSIIEGRLYNDYDFSVYSGVSNPDHEKIASLLKDILKIRHQRHCSSIPDEFKATDLAIGACGGMFVERILAGIPAINVEIADNQKGCGNFVKELKLGAVLSVEELLNPELIKNALLDLEKNSRIYAENCRGVYDPKGIINVRDHLLELLTHS